MDRWDVIIILVAGYVAVVSLVRLMTKRRDELIDEVHEQLAKRRKKAQPSKERAE